MRWPSTPAASSSTTAGSASSAAASRLNLVARNPALAGGTAPGHLLVAVDALGGAFAVNGGGLPGTPGDVAYFGPDDLTWTSLGLGHHAFVGWALTDDLAAFSEHLRWPGWEAEVEALPLDRGILPYPFPFTVEGRDVGAAARKPVPMEELLAIWPDLAAQLSDQRASGPPAPAPKAGRWRRGRGR